MNLDQAIDETISPITGVISDVIFFSLNIAGVDIPVIAFWLITAGFLGMATKMVECTLGVAYRRINTDGTVSGGPMYYIPGDDRVRRCDVLCHGRPECDRPVYLGPQVKREIEGYVARIRSGTIRRAGSLPGTPTRNM